MSYSLSPGLSKIAALGAVLDRQNGPLAAIMEMMALAADSGSTFLTIAFGAKDVSATFNGELAQPGAGHDRRGWMPVQVYHLTDRPLLAGNGWGAMLEAGAEVFTIAMTPPRAAVRLSLPYRINASPLSAALGIAPLNGDVLHRLVNSLHLELRRGLYFTDTLLDVQVVLNGSIVLQAHREAEAWEILPDGCRHRMIGIQTQSRTGESVRFYREYSNAMDAYRVVIPAPESPIHEMWEDSGIFGTGAGRWLAPVPVAFRGPFELARAGFPLTPSAIASELNSLGQLLARAISHERERPLDSWIALWPAEPVRDPSHPLASLIEGFWSTIPSLEVLLDVHGRWWRPEAAPLSRALGEPTSMSDLHPLFDEHFPRFSRRFAVQSSAFLAAKAAETKADIYKEATVAFASDENDLASRVAPESEAEQPRSRRSPTRGLASLTDGLYRVRYVEAGVEVHVEKLGGEANPTARVRAVLAGITPYNPEMHAPLPGNLATPEVRADALTRLYETELTAYAQITPFLNVVIGVRSHWGASYKSFTPLAASPVHFR